MCYHIMELMAPGVRRRPSRLATSGVPLTPQREDRTCQRRCTRATRVTSPRRSLDSSATPAPRRPFWRPIPSNVSTTSSPPRPGRSSSPAARGARRAAVATPVSAMSTDKFTKNQRKTIGTLRDLTGAHSVGVIARVRRARHHRVRQADGRRRGGLPVHQPRGHPGEQDDHGAQGRQRRHPLAVAQGRLHVRLLVDYIHAEARQGGRTARPGAVHRGAEKALTYELMKQADLVVVTGSQSNVRSAYCQWHPGDRGRRRQRPGDHRLRCGPRRRRRQGQAQQDVRLRDELLVRKLGAHRRRRLRRCAQPPALPTSATC